MLDLTPYATRVQVAISTNQCLDYARDVSDLINEVQRLRSGYGAMQELHDSVRRKAAVGVGITFSEMREAGQLERGVRMALEAFEKGAV